ncbi:hypothetical protein J6590_000322 [Homalodisca vitripennis]|nr:hypothetical protein J6590_000322 [Homalodisca vitripennis]
MRRLQHTLRDRGLSEQRSQILWQRDDYSTLCAIGGFVGTTLSDTVATQRLQHTLRDDPKGFVGTTLSDTVATRRLQHTLRDWGLSEQRSQILWQRDDYSTLCAIGVCRNNALRYCGNATTTAHSAR